MRADFRVSSATLEGLARRMLSLVQELDAAGTFGQNPGAAAHPAVESSLQTFFSHWASEMQKAEQMLQDLGGHLDGAGAAYSQADAVISAEFS